MFCRWMAFRGPNRSVQTVIASVAELVAENLLTNGGEPPMIGVFNSNPTVTYRLTVQADFLSKALLPVFQPSLPLFWLCTSLSLSAPPAVPLLQSNTVDLTPESLTATSTQFAGVSVGQITYGSSADQVVANITCTRGLGFVGLLRFAALSSCVCGQLHARTPHRTRVRG